MQGIEIKPETAGQEPKGGSAKEKRRLLFGLGITAACLALALSACVSEAEHPGPEVGSAPAGSGELEPDTEGPRLLGVKDITVVVGGTVSYRNGVSAVDNVDGTVPFQVDAAAVDLTVPGVYQVVYSAKDAAGNQTQATATVTVEQEAQDDDLDDPADPNGGPSPSSGGSPSSGQATEEEVNRLADQILEQILRDGMSQREQARAIFNYVNQHIRYVGTSDKSSWLVGAYTGFTRQRGDCYNYFACSKALLTRAGIPNIDLERVGGTSHHYWQLVNTGDGWYHFDACPHPTGYPLVAFMITETQARTYTEQVKRARSNYYVYDYDACPVQVEGTPPEDWRPPVFTPPPAVTEPSVETEEPPEVAEGPEESQLPAALEFPAETEELPPEWIGPPAESQPEELPPEWIEPPTESQPEELPEWLAQPEPGTEDWLERQPDGGE